MGLNPNNETQNTCDMDWFQATYRLCCIFSALKHGKLLEDETENNKLGIRHTANEIVTVQPREFPLCEPWQQPSECTPAPEHMGECRFAYDTPTRYHLKPR